MAFFDERGGMQGRCPLPFLQEDRFPDTGGFTAGRMCQPVASVNITCCLPCPITDWLYADGFQQRTTVANWVNVAALVATVFLLTSFVALPVKWTHRHYLSICLVMSVLVLELAAIIPLVAQPDQCYNDITPNDMRSDRTCAFSGAFLLFGGWAAVSWVFWRALSLHLQICWDVVPGRGFLYTAMALGWGIPAAGLATTLSLTGVSYRFGSICHINHDRGLADFWAPLLVFAAMALVLQFITVGYCVHIYLRSVLNDRPHSQGRDTDLPSFHGSLSVVSTKQTYRRVMRVLWLQWRGATVVLVIIAEVIFFSIVFVTMDNSSQLDQTLIQKSEPWVRCLTLSSGDKNKCLAETGAFVQSEAVVIAVLVVLGLSGFWCLLFLGRWSMVLGWIDLVKRHTTRRHGLMSPEQFQPSVAVNDRNYEMLGSVKETQALAQHQSPTSPTMSPSSPYDTSLSAENKMFDEYFNQRPTSRTKDDRAVHFSRPRPPPPVVIASTRDPTEPRRSGQ